jgi:RHS repeat-associated protein
MCKTMRVVRGIAALLGCIVMLCLGTIASANTDAAPADGSISPRELVDSSNGDFTYGIPIDVPAFHGIEPHLRLAYRSTQQIDYLGVGWALSGLSAVQITSSRHGAPLAVNDTTSYYGAVGVYELDGEEIYRCNGPFTGISTPSCSTGGTHSSESENYLRITRHDDTGQWEVWTRDGTKLTYATSDVVSNIDKRYLSSVTDTHGNNAQYNYSCAAAEACRIDTIAYNGVTVRFYWEARPDIVKYSDGLFGRRISSRIKTIDVLVGADRLRSYALTYDLSPSSGRSRLHSVQQYGRDAVVDASGNVTAGTSLPPIVFGYSVSANTFMKSAWATGQGTFGAANLWVTGDFNDDGRTDFAKTQIASCKIDVQKSSGNAFTREQWAIAGCVTTAGSLWRAGDFNGDGKTDLVQINATASALTTHVFLSTGTGFTYQNWGSFSGSWASSIWIAADINGDGKADLVRDRENADCTTNVVISQGASFSLNTWPQALACNAGKLTEVGDFNGDGRADFSNRLYGQQIFAIDVKYSSPQLNTFSTRYTSVANPHVTNEKWFIGDVTGDGTSDFVKVTPSGSALTADVLWSMPNFIIDTQTEVFNSSFGSSTWVGSTSYKWVTGDFNGDGRDDLAITNASWTKVLRSTGSQMVLEDWETGSSLYNSSGTRAVGDFNGDGKDEIADFFSSGGNWAANVHVSNGGFADLLTSVVNSLGGSTSVAYMPSSSYANTNLPMVLPTASSVTADDGRGTVSTTTYGYAGGVWNQVVRRFLGFSTVTATLPCNSGETQCPKLETTFAQTLACAQSPLSIKEEDGTGAILRQTDNTYADNSAALPYTCLNTATQKTVTVGGSSKYAGVTRTFDSYGNVTTLTRHGALTSPGNYTATGDETTAEAVYQPNTTAYIVSPPARVRTYAGIGTGGTKLTENFAYYDGNTSNWQTPPVKGDVTQVQAWRDLPSSGYITSSAVYDSYGNVTSRTDPLGNVTSLIYDTTYHLFVTEARDPLYPTDSRHKTTATYLSSPTNDFVCGMPSKTTDMNGLDTTYQYDALCRPRKVTTPSGAFACTNYLSLGSPTAQNIETQTSPPAPETVTACDASAFTPGANLWSRRYLDGFGRAYRGSSEGPGGSQTAIEALTAYNARGGVASATTPYYTADPQYSTTWKYDALDRKIELDHPDTKKLLQSFNLSTISNGFEKITVTDELNRPHTVHSDALGRTIQSDALLGGSTVSTSYQYDLLDRLIGITDAAGNHWTYAYDSLGRRLSVADPDLGTWTYVYDNAGRLTDQTDAKHQVTHFTYDAFGRVLTKTVTPDISNSASATYTYDQARTGYYNVGHQTTAANFYASIAYNFDNDGRHAGETYTVNSVNYSFGWSFDLGGRILSQSYPDGDSVGTLGYDGAGRLTTVPGIVTGVIYDAAGHQTNVTRQNGASTTLGWSAQRGWLNSIFTSSTAGTIQDYTYNRDDLGRITGVTSSQAGEGWIYTYDDLDRLLSADNTTDNTFDQTFTYDVVGNMLTNSKVGTYTYPAPGSPRPHAVTGISGGPLGTQSFTYDANGSMTNEGGDSITYDAANRQLTFTGGGTSEQFFYAPDGARLKKIGNGSIILYFGDDVELKTTGTPQYTKYLPGDAKKVGSGGSGTFYWLHRDLLQSVRAITSSSGALLDSAKYRPFGEQIGFANVTESKGFTGQRDDEDGLLYLHARYYDPVLGRFIQADPMDPAVTGVGVNRYSYAFNDPVMMLDPFGLNVSEGLHHGDGNGSPQGDPANHGVGCTCNDHMAGRVGAVPPLPDDQLKALHSFFAAGGIAPTLESGALIAQFAGGLTVALDKGAIFVHAPNVPYGIVVAFGLDKILAAPQRGEVVTIAYQGVFHDQVVKALADYLRGGGLKVETEVSLEMADGSIGARIDILAQAGVELFGVEVKTGENPSFTPQQLVVYPHLMMGESVISTSPEITTFGFQPGQLLPATPVYLMYQQDSSTKPQVFELDPKKMLNP